jgi:hypothetical protein
VFDSLFPVTGSPTTVGDRNNLDDFFSLPINDAGGKPFHYLTTRARKMHSTRIRERLYLIDCFIEFCDERFCRGGASGCVPIVGGLCFGKRLLMKFDLFGAHLPGDYQATSC